MLDGRDDMVRLRAFRIKTGKAANQKGIFAKILEVAAAPRVACQIGASREEDVETAIVRIAPDRTAEGFEQGRVP